MVDFNQAELSIMSATDVIKVYDGLKSIGVTRVRLEADWALIELTPGQYSWAGLDAAVVPAAQYDIAPVIEISGGTHAPQWGAPDNYATFCAAVAKRYGPLAYEIWNEPNNWAFMPALSPTIYTDYLRVAYAAIKNVAPDATVVTAGVMSTLTWLFTVDPVDWVKAMYAAGAKGYFDAIGFHPYTGNPYSGAAQEPTDTNIGIAQSDSIHDVMVANGDGDKQVWWTEFGQSVGSGNGQVSEDVQAQWLTEQVHLGLARPYVGPQFIYNYRNTTSDANLENNMGVVNYDWSPKLSWHAVREINASTIGGELTPEQAQQLATILSNQEKILANQALILDVVRAARTGTVTIKKLTS